MRNLLDPMPKKPQGPKNAPTPTIPRPQVNKNHTAQKQPSHPEMYTRQLNPISNKFGQPQYHNEGIPTNYEPARDQGLPGDALRSLLEKLLSPQ